MAAYEELPGLVGQKFQTEYFSRKTPKPVVQKSIAKVSKVPLRAFHNYPQPEVGYGQISSHYFRL
jgi:hypothetical protein